MTYDLQGVRGAFNLRSGQSFDSQTKGKGTCRTGRLTVRPAVLLLCGMLLALALGACGNADGDGDATIHENLKVKNLQIVDDDGNTRAVFTTISGGRPSLTLLDSAGDFRAWLTLNDDGSPNLLLIDKGRVVLMDGSGGVRSTYSLDEAGNPSMRHFSEAGGVRSSVALDDGEAPILELFDEGGRVIWSAP